MNLLGRKQLNLRGEADVLVSPTSGRINLLLLHQPAQLCRCCKQSKFWEATIYFRYFHPHILSPEAVLSIGSKRFRCRPTILFDWIYSVNTFKTLYASNCCICVTDPTEGAIEIMSSIRFLFLPFI